MTAVRLHRRRFHRRHRPAETLSRNGMRTIQLLGVPDTALASKPPTGRRWSWP
ncbi:MAG: hypothetical protein ACLR0N_09370 [Bilophila wadsworthia]